MRQRDLSGAIPKRTATIHHGIDSLALVIERPLKSPICVHPLPNPRDVSLIRFFAAVFSNPNDPTKQSTGFGFGQQTQQTGGTTPSTPGQQTSTPQPTPSPFGVSSTPAANPPAMAGFGLQPTTSMFAPPATMGFGTQPAGGGFGTGTVSPAPIPSAFGGTSSSAPMGTTGMAQPSAFGSSLNNPPSTFGGATTSGFGTTRFKIVTHS